MRTNTLLDLLQNICCPQGYLNACPFTLGTHRSEGVFIWSSSSQTQWERDVLIVFHHKLINDEKGGLIVFLHQLLNEEMLVSVNAKGIFWPFYHIAALYGNDANDYRFV